MFLSGRDRPPARPGDTERNDPMIYLDNAATTKTSPAAQKAMLECMEQFWGNPSSLHTPGQKAAEALAQARETVAACIGAEDRKSVV